MHLISSHITEVGGVSHAWVCREGSPTATWRRCLKSWNSVLVTFLRVCFGSELEDIWSIVAEERCKVTGHVASAVREQREMNASLRSQFGPLARRMALPTFRMALLISVNLV